MSQEGLEQFYRLVFDEPVLQEQLKAISSREEFVMLMVRLGAERGCDFTREEVESALQTARRVWIERWI